MALVQNPLLSNILHILLPEILTIIAEWSKGLCSSRSLSWCGFQIHWFHTCYTYNSQKYSPSMKSSRSIHSNNLYVQYLHYNTNQKYITIHQYGYITIYHLWVIARFLNKYNSGGPYHQEHANKHCCTYLAKLQLNRNRHPR